MGLGNNISKYLLEKAKQQRIPLTVNFELLPICNLDCKMCYIRSDWKDVEENGGLIGVDQWLKIAKQLKDVGTLYILLTGGEVFVYPEFERLYVELYKMGFSITINTNATLIDEKIISWLKKYPPKCVSISLYGSNNEVYEEICGRKNMFTRVDNAIQLLKGNGIYVELKTMLTPYNYRDLEKCWEYAKSLNISYEAAIYSFPPVRKIQRSSTQIRFDPYEAAECYFYRNRIMSNDGEYTSEIVKHLKRYEDTKGILGKDHIGFNCSAGNTSCWISWKGDMLSCAMIVEPCTYPFEIGFLNAWEELKKEVDKIKMSSKCSHCNKRQVCTVCPASAYTETGRIDGTSSYHCVLTSRILEKMKKYVNENNIDINKFQIDEEK